jgi:hypothetical protein
MEEEQKEEADVERMFNVSIHSVPESTLDEFRAFARAYAFNKYAVALRLLLDRSTMFEIFSSHESRLRVLEDRANTTPVQDEGKAVRKSVKTFGKR